MSWSGAGPAKKRAYRSGYEMTQLNQTQRFKTGMVPAADHEMVVHLDVQRLCRIGDLAGHDNVAAARCGIAARMIVHQDEGGGTQLQRALHHFPRIDGGMID